MTVCSFWAGNPKNYPLVKLFFLAMLMFCLFRLSFYILMVQLKCYKTLNFSHKKSTYTMAVLDAPTMLLAIQLYEPELPLCMLDIV